MQPDMDVVAAFLRNHYVEVLLSACCLLPIAHCMLLVVIAHCMLLVVIAHCLLLSCFLLLAYALWLIAYFFFLIAHG